MDITGKNVFIRTVTNYYTGKVVEESDKYIVLKDAAWIPDTGRFGTALSTCEFNEVEPYPELVLVATGSIVDITFIKELPRTQH